MEGTEACNCSLHATLAHSADSTMLCHTANGRERRDQQNHSVLHITQLMVGKEGTSRAIAYCITQLMVGKENKCTETSNTYSALHFDGE